MKEQKRFMKIRLGAIAADASGSLGGGVFSKNKGGNYVRRRTKPVNPNTAAQVRQRQYLTQNAQNWRGLTDAQRASFAALAASITTRDRLGSPIRLSGQQLYSRINTNLLTVGSSTLSSAPVPGSIGAPTSASLAVTAIGPVLTLTFAPTVPANTKFMVFATPALGAGITFIKNRLRFIFSINAAATSPQNISTSYTAVFPGAITAGQKVWLVIRPINTTTGFTGQDLLIVATAA